MKTEKILYYETAGNRNTEQTIQAAFERAKSVGIRDVVVASTSGETGVKACEVFRGFNLVVVTTHVGFETPGVAKLQKPNEEKIKALGGKIFTGTHALSGAERAIRTKWNTVEPLEIVSEALRIFGHGTKVCAEIVIMAVDAGLIPVDRDVLAIGGTGSGADTALIISPAHANNFFQMTVREIICKPTARE